MRVFIIALLAAISYAQTGANATESASTNATQPERASNESSTTNETVSNYMLSPNTASPKCPNGSYPVTTSSECERAGKELSFTSFNTNSSQGRPLSSCWINNATKELNFNLLKKYSFAFACKDGNSSAYTFQVGGCSEGRVNSAADCKAAGTAKNMTFEIAGDYSYVPPNTCFEEQSKLYFNSGEGWVGQIICRQNGTTVVETVEETTEETASEEVSLEIGVAGATEGNKDQICESIASALNGASTYCSLKGPQSNRRHLAEEVPLYMDATVADRSTAKAQAMSSDFVGSLQSLPTGVAVKGVSIISKEDTTSPPGYFKTACPDCSGERPEPLEPHEIVDLHNTGESVIYKKDKNLQEAFNFSLSSDVTGFVDVQKQDDVLTPYANRTLDRAAIVDFVHTALKKLTLPPEQREMGLVFTTWVDWINPTHIGQVFHLGEQGSGYPPNPVIWGWAQLAFTNDTEVAVKLKPRYFTGYQVVDEYFCFGEEDWCTEKAHIYMAKRGWVFPGSYVPPVCLPTNPCCKDTYTNASNIVVVKDHQYGEAFDLDGTTPYPLFYDMYQPKIRSEKDPIKNVKKPLMIVVHGGKYMPNVTKSNDAIAINYAKAFARRGFLSAVIEYRRWNGHARNLNNEAEARMIWDPRFDIQAALRFFVKKASVLDIDPERIGIIGEATGAVIVSGAIMIDLDKFMTERYQEEIDKNKYQYKAEDWCKNNPNDLSCHCSMKYATQSKTGCNSGTWGTPGKEKLKVILSVSGGIEERVTSDQWRPECELRPYFAVHNLPDSTISFLVSQFTKHNLDEMNIPNFLHTVDKPGHVPDIFNEKGTINDKVFDDMFAWTLRHLDMKQCTMSGHPYTPTACNSNGGTTLNTNIASDSLYLIGKIPQLKWLLLWLYLPLALISFCVIAKYCWRKDPSTEPLLADYSA